MVATVLDFKPEPYREDGFLHSSGGLKSPETYVLRSNNNVNIRGRHSRKAHAWHVDGMDQGCTRRYVVITLKRARERE